MNKLQEMLKLQQQLNDTTNGTAWENGITKQGKVIDWRRCIWLECAELIESYPWKHWKNIAAEPDYKNIAIELVDIWHFVMSEALRVYKVENLGDIEKLTSDIEALQSFQEFTNVTTHTEKEDIYTQMHKIETFVATLFNDTPILTLTATFFTITSNANLNLERLYQLYIGKNILNQFRQDHGYKEGTYIKEWKGKEDNLVMQTILNQQTSMTPEALYHALKEAYPAP
jgi:dimeric dUTPase (all-alpha-NTP-PPase superfamily)